MDQLPNHKIPKIGAPGEKYRDIQLIIQLPKHDLSEEFCQTISTPFLVKAFDEFKDMRDTYVMDIGYIQEDLKEDMVRDCIFL